MAINQVIICFWQAVITFRCLPFCTTIISHAPQLILGLELGLQNLARHPRKTLYTAVRGQWRKSTADSLGFTCLTLSAAAESTFKYLQYRWSENHEQQVERLKENQFMHVCLPDTAEPSLNQISFVCFLGHMFPSQ